MCESGKQVYATPEMARRVAKRMRRQDKKVAPYRCRFCRLWHLTTADSFNRTRRDER